MAVEIPDIAAPLSKRKGDGELMTISEMSGKFDVTLRALRFYEEKHLLKPLRKGKRRLYTERDVSRMRVIRQAKQIGLTLIEIRSVFAIIEGRKSRTQQLRSLREICAGQESLLLDQKDQISGQIQEMKKVILSLDAMIATGAD